MTCMHNRDDQCFCDCPDCVRYEGKECSECGCSGNLYDIGEEYLCEECMLEKYSGSKNNFFQEFIEDHIDEYNKFVIRLMRDCKV